MFREMQNEFKENGFVLLKNQLSEPEIKLLDMEYNLLIEESKKILQYVIKENLSLSEFFKHNPRELIVVPEASNCFDVCRFEYIAGYSKTINDIIIAKVKDLIDKMMEEPFILFKDKCNVKNAEGGAFPPHQDIAAYYHFKPKFHVTAAVMLDDATIENGCLEMAIGYKNISDGKTHSMKSRFGSFPVFDFHSGGKNNGNIKEWITEKMVWNSMQANKGDIVLFDSFVPHCSKKNNSKNRRRNFFFTFNSLSDGDYYEEYYSVKRRDFNNPIFHVATPTKHAALD